MASALRSPGRRSRGPSRDDRHSPPPAFSQLRAISTPNMSGLVHDELARPTRVLVLDRVTRQAGPDLLDADDDVHGGSQAADEGLRASNYERVNHVLVICHTTARILRADESSGSRHPVAQQDLGLQAGPPWPPFSVIDRLPEPPSAAASKGTLVTGPSSCSCCARRRSGRSTRPGRHWTAPGRTRRASRIQRVGSHRRGAGGFPRRRRGPRRALLRARDPLMVRPVGLELMMTVEVGRAHAAGHHRPARARPRRAVGGHRLQDGRHPASGVRAGRWPACTLLAAVRTAAGGPPGRIQLMYLSRPEVISLHAQRASVGGAERLAVALYERWSGRATRDDFRPNRAGCATTAPSVATARRGVATRHPPASFVPC